MKKIGLYIHIPFCKSKCAYCAFTSFHCDNVTIGQYIAALCSEIESTLDENIIIDTMYIGGGTPSILDIDDVQRIVTTVKRCSTFSPRECTIECNPESLTEEKIIAYKDMGINRISMGVQSLNNDILKTIGRVHTSEQAVDRARLVKRYDMNLSVDMILGLPNSTMDDIRHFIDTFSSIGVNHISAYSLSVEPGTRLEKMVNSGQVDLPCEDDTVDQYEYAYELLEKKGYHRYEVSNFAKTGCESKHNNKYWTMEEYIGVGLASHSYNNGIRYYNTKNIHEYIELINAGKRASTTDEVLTLRDRVEETLMLGLRLEKGVSIDTLDRLVGGDFLALDKVNIDRMREYIHIEDGHIAIRPEYMNVMNTIIVDLLE